MLIEPPRTLPSEAFADGFPGFIRSFGNSASIEYVADIAELEMLRSQARCAAESMPLPQAELRTLNLERLQGLRITLHPSVGLIQSRFPIVTIWENNQVDDDDRMIERWGAEAALIARPFAEVEVRRLPAGGFAFVQSLSQGSTVASAVCAASAAAPKFNAIRNLRLLEQANVIVAIQQAPESQGLSAEISTGGELRTMLPGARDDCQQAK
jgi:hypothetical protein